MSNQVENTTDVGGLEVVQHPPLISEFLQNGDIYAHVLSCRNLDSGDSAVLLQGRFGYAQGTIEVEGLEDGDIVKLTKGEGDTSNPIATIVG